MFVILATKPLNDGTKGFRFNFFGKKGIIRRRKLQSNGMKFVKGDCMNAYHIGRLQSILNYPLTLAVDAGSDT